MGQQVRIGWILEEDKLLACKFYPWPYTHSLTSGTREIGERRKAVQDGSRSQKALRAAVGSRDLNCLAGGFAEGRREQDNTLLRYKISLTTEVRTEIVERSCASPGLAWGAPISTRCGASVFALDQRRSEVCVLIFTYLDHVLIA